MNIYIYFPLKPPYDLQVIDGDLGCPFCWKPTIQETIDINNKQKHHHLSINNGYNNGYNNHIVN